MKYRYQRITMLISLLFLNFSNPLNKLLLSTYLINLKVFIIFRNYHYHENILFYYYLKQRNNGG